MKPNIAFTGKAGSGKTTCAELLLKHFGYRKLSFAKRLKEISVELFGPGSDTNRDILIPFGMAARELDPDVWVNAAIREFDEATDVHPRFDAVPVFTVDDLRFENEYWALRGRGFKIVRVAASDAIREDRLRRNGKTQTEEQKTHASETQLDALPVDWIIYNEDIETTWHALQLLIGKWDK